jgi:hypothetical protein
MTREDINKLKNGERIEGEWDDYYFFDNRRNKIGYHFCIDRENWIYDDEYFNEEEVLDND